MLGRRFAPTKGAWGSSVPRRLVHHVEERFAVGEAAQVLGHDLAAAAGGAGSGGAVVGGDDHVGEGPELGVGGKGLDVVGVEAGASDLAAFQGVDQGRVVDDAAPG